MVVDPLLIAIAVVLGIILVLLGLLLRAHGKPVTDGQRRVQTVQVAQSSANDARRPARARVARSRLPRASEEIPIDTLEPNHLLQDSPSETVSEISEFGKIGTKKLKKLEEKAERRRQRELELQEREEQKQKQIEEDERRRKQAQKEQDEKRERDEALLRETEEKRRREEEEYLKMKAAFEIEDEGFEQDEDSNTTGKLEEFISFINENKVLQLEDLAARFSLKTQDCVDRVKTLLTEERLCGVIDDRGKFIAITKEELLEVAKFIKVRGRVSIQELVESSNRLVNLALA